MARTQFYCCGHTIYRCVLLFLALPFVARNITRRTRRKQFRRLKRCSRRTLYSFVLVLRLRTCCKRRKASCAHNSLFDWRLLSLRVSRESSTSSSLLLKINNFHFASTTAASTDLLNCFVVVVVVQQRFVTHTS